MMRRMEDARFNQLLAAWQQAETALEAYRAERGPCADPAVKRLVARQFQFVAWRRYGQLCRYVADCRKRLPRL
jgi:hypothetical protein